MYNIQIDPGIAYEDIWIQATRSLLSYKQGSSFHRRGTTTANKLSPALPSSYRDRPSLYKVFKAIEQRETHLSKVLDR